MNLGSSIEFFLAILTGVSFLAISTLTGVPVLDSMVADFEVKSSFRLAQMIFRFFFILLTDL